MFDALLSAVSEFVEVRGSLTSTMNRLSALRCNSSLNRWGAEHIMPTEPNPTVSINSSDSSPLMDKPQQGNKTYIMRRTPSQRPSPRIIHPKQLTPLWRPRSSHIKPSIRRPPSQVRELRVQILITISKSALFPLTLFPRPHTYDI